ncbi:glycosyltransferase [Cognatilysobacter bugurensis]|uniref:Glycosyltransferase 2-like domain-containing protein n=1 Tax=Cognatilysobacter bugurensis TaxID=543356 RepID=A0A918W8E4_9GAMM|nr:glycosyltransferase [Lysobacter bugurensis]GHA80674.1 hypothetical protein GCM10007067_18230 [Lysobacter bugurensis]
MSAELLLGRLTVVIPVGPGDALEPTLRTQLAQLPAAAEVRVVFASEADARGFCAHTALSGGPAWHVHVSPPGRSLQQNAGAAAATRPWLWFLHADSRLADDTLTALAAFIHADEPVLGYFDLRFLNDGPRLMWLNTLGTWVRSRWLGLPFGDQGLVMPRVMFEGLGGFDPALRCGEDHDLVWRARRAGRPPRAVRASLYTSARKYAQHGWVRTTAWTLTETARQVWRFARARSRA